MANTGVAGWIVRIAAVAFGVASIAGLALVTLGGALLVLLVVGAVHASRKDAARPFTLFHSWITAVVVSAIVVSAAIAWGLSRSDKTGASVFHSLVTAADTADRNPQPPPPRILRYLPGGNVQPAALPKSAVAPLLVVTFVIMAEMIGAVVGSLIWGAAWLTVSGLSGRLAGVKPAMYSAP